MICLSQYNLVDYAFFCRICRDYAFFVAISCRILLRILAEILRKKLATGASEQDNETRGYHGDLNETIFVGEVSQKAKDLVVNTWECLEKAITECVKPGVKYRDVGGVIQKHATTGGYSVVRSYCGHGIHKLFHCAPNVPHYAKNKAVGVMKPGHCFTIEPMISEGVWGDQTWPDNWTSVTQDGKLSAQFEQTMVVTDTGVEVFPFSYFASTTHQ